ncbi:MAG: DUF503 domain-containing protein [Firmicutes bacterium]|nr:DUF503 domain-containing protein [Bacillota bacterium]
MVVGVLTLELLLPGANSLKEKRRALKSLLDRLRARFNVAAAEVDRQDVWRRATVGLALVSNSRSHAQDVLDALVKFVGEADGVEILSYTTDFY